MGKFSIFAQSLLGKHEESMDAVEVKSITKTFRSSTKQEGLWGSLKSVVHREYKHYTAVNDVSFAVPQGQLLGLLGANGAGKTTLLKMLSGLLVPTSGQASVLGFIPWRRKHEFLHRFPLVMGPRNQLWWDLPAADSFLLNKEIYGLEHNSFVKWRDELAERLDVADKLHIQLRRLSLGERMKCELIGALLHKPEVIFLDEPTIGLDVVAQHSLREFIQQYNRDFKTTVILTSHYMDDIEALCERVILIDEGSLLFDGQLEELSKEFSAEKVLQLDFLKPFNQKDIESFGTVTECSSERIILRIDAENTPTITAQILSQYPVADLTITAVPIEEIVRKIFVKNSGEIEKK